MKTVKDFIAVTYKKIKGKYWNDPVWSNVISAIIIAILTTFYLLIKSLVKEISFKEAVKELVYFFNQKTYVNNFIIALAVMIFLFLLIRLTIDLIINIRKRKVSALSGQIEEELSIVPFESTVFFSYRIASAFPGERGVVWYNDPKIIVERLSILLQSPLKFKSGRDDSFSSTPFWWFRDTSSMHITNFEKLSKTKVLIGIEEFEIKRMAVNIDKLYYKCFIYLEVKGEKQTGLYKINEEDRKRHIETFGYSWEEYGLFNKIPISRKEYDDGSAIIKSKVVETDGADLRIRYLSDYNILIAGHNSPFNSDKFERESEKYFNGILTKKETPESFFEFLSGFSKVHW